VPSGAIVLLCLAAATHAQDTAPAGGKSFLNIILDGAEWPGVIIALLSVAAVTIIVEHFWTIRRSTMVPEAEIRATREFIEARRFKECIDYLNGSKTMFADVLRAGLRHGRHGFAAMHEAAEEQAGAWSSRLFRKAESLNIIGNLAPLMGLLGTVLGMIEAFGAMEAEHGAAKPEHLAGGISLALVNTFLGLGVAIIALGFFGVCRNRVDAMTVAAHASVMDLLEHFRPVAHAGRAMGGEGPAAPPKQESTPQAPAPPTMRPPTPQSPAPEGEKPVPTGSRPQPTAQPPR